MVLVLKRHGRLSADYVDVFVYFLSPVCRNGQVGIYWWFPKELPHKILAKFKSNKLAWWFYMRVIFICVGSRNIMTPVH